MAIPIAAEATRGMTATKTKNFRTAAEGIERADGAKAPGRRELRQAPGRDSELLKSPRRILAVGEIELRQICAATPDVAHTLLSAALRFLSAFPALVVMPEE